MSLYPVCNHLELGVSLETEPLTSQALRRVDHTSFPLSYIFLLELVFQLEMEVEKFV